MNLAIIPGYREAVQKERFGRTAAFVPPLRETVCGVKVLPLTLGHLAILETIGSPFISGGPINILAIGTFLWIVSEDFVPPKNWRANRARKQFLHAVGKMRFPAPDPLPIKFDSARWTLEQAALQIFNYIAEAEQDLPGGSVKARGISNYSSTAAIIDLLAAEYGWSEEIILAIPLKRVLQYVNRIRERKGDERCAFNPSDAIRQKWLEEHQPARN